MRWRSRLLVSSAFVTAAVFQAYGHGAIELKTIDGKPVSQTLNLNDCITVKDKTYCAGDPVSWEVTCGSCHDEVTGDVSGGLKTPGPIHRAYHVGRGWEELSDSFGADRVRQGKDWRKFIRSFGDDGAW